ncbi:MAG: minor capsid protein [Oscillospiraceae bacterium]|nr:minor capsid protein [Oscillospiraceae bacterium]
MAQKSAEYWRERFLALEEQNNRSAAEAVKETVAAFNQALAQAEKELNAWYNRFAQNNEISLPEAKKWLAAKELKELRWDVEEYIRYGQENALNHQWMKELENASAKFHISRLEALKIRIQQSVEQAYQKQTDQLQQLLADQYTEDYYHTVYEIQKGLGAGWNIGQIDQRRLDLILSRPWTADGLTFSDRIWNSKTQLLDNVFKGLTQMCLLGEDPKKAIDRLAAQMNVSKKQAGRLIMTESAYIGSKAQQDCFNDLEVEWFEIIATLDFKTSEICRRMDGEVARMSDYQIGVTAPPFHPWCRSCTCPWFADDEPGMRAARGVDGKTYYVPADMTYQEWYEKQVEEGFEEFKLFPEEKKLIYKGYEEGLLLDLDGSVIFKTSGTESQVRVPKEYLNKAEGKIFTHSHPSDYPPSDTDVYRMYQYKMSEVRAVTTEGVYRVVNTGKWKKEFDSAEEFRLFYYEIGAELIEQYGEKIEQGLISIGEAEKIVQDSVLKELSERLGFVYEFTER